MAIKGDSDIIEDIKVQPANEEEEFVKNFPLDKKKKALRKLDVRILPTLLVLYMAAHLDRANIGNAKVEGLEKDLGMTGTDYNVASGIFFLPYILFEMPSNFVLKNYFSNYPSLWIGFLASSWGIVMTLTGIVQNLSGLIVTRIFLGAFEAGFFPGAIMLLSSWYEKRELQTRISILYTASAISGAVSGLLAFGIAKMDQIGGLEGWRWIFILEGIATVLIAIICVFTLPNAPEKSTRWLDQDEIRFFKSRIIIQDGGHEGSGFSWKLLQNTFLDWKIWVFGMIYWSAAAPIYGLKFTLPDIITTMGFESAEAQLLSMPPYAVGGITSYVLALIADKYFWRMPFLVGPQLSEVIGFAILLGLPIATNVPACYFAVCMITAGVFPLVPAVNAWTSNNLAGAEKRSLGIALFVSIGNLGSIIGSFMFKSSEKPRYPTGYGLGTAICFYGAILSFLLEFVFWKLNKKNSKVSIDEVNEMYTSQELAMLGDKSPLFKYTL